MLLRPARDETGRAGASCARAPLWWHAPPRRHCTRTKVRAASTRASARKRPRAQPHVQVCKQVGHVACAWAWGGGGRGVDGAAARTWARGGAGKGHSTPFPSAHQPGGRRWQCPRRCHWRTRSGGRTWQRGSGRAGGGVSARVGVCRSQSGSPATPTRASPVYAEVVVVLCGDDKARNQVVLPVVVVYRVVAAQPRHACARRASHFCRTNVHVTARGGRGEGCQQLLGGVALVHIGACCPT